MGLGLVALLAGCASNDENGMGGTGDDSWKTDSIHNSSDQFHNNATHGTGSSDLGPRDVGPTDAGPNNATGLDMAR